MQLIVHAPPYSDESPLGYLQRLAQINALDSSKTLARAVELDTSTPSLLRNAAELCRQYNLAPEWTKSVSTSLKSCLSLKAFHKAGHYKVCPHCLAESAHLRAAWEHAYVVACPVHECLLVDLCPCCQEPLKKGLNGTHYCRCGCNLQTVETQPATPVQTLLAQALSGKKMGPTPSSLEAILGKASPLALSQLIRVLCLYADPNTQPPRLNLAAPSSLAQAIDFLAPLEKIFSLWPQSFEAHVQSRLAFAPKEAFTANTALGSWYRLVKGLTTEGPLKPFLSCIVRVLHEASIVSSLRDAAQHVSIEANKFISLKLAAVHLGVSRDTLLKAVQHGVVAHRALPRGAHKFSYEVSLDEIERLHQHRRQWCSPQEACEELGITASLLKNMLAAGLVERDTKWRSDILKNGEFSRNSLEQFTTNLRTLKCASSAQKTTRFSELATAQTGENLSIQKVLRALAAGHIRIVSAADKLGQFLLNSDDVSKHSSLPLLDEGMTIDVLAKHTGWKWESISHWIKCGLLKAYECKRHGQRCRVVLPTDLLEFQRTYITTADAARLLESKASYLSELIPGLEVVGAKVLPNGTHRGGLVQLKQLCQLATVRTKRPLLQTSSKSNGMSNHKFGSLPSAAGCS